jgi:uncharacterized membrane protein
MALATITTYQWFLAAHILAAVVWVGGALTIQLFAMRARAAHSGQRMADFAADAEFVGMRVFMPASLVLIVFGFLLIHQGHWGYKAWVVFPLVVWVLSFLTGAGFLGPESGRLNALIAREGVDHPEVSARIDRIFLVSRIELVLLLLVVADMTLKPGA